MQHGDLTEVQIARFDAAQAYLVRKPTFVAWIEGFGDTTKYIMEIDSEVALESPQGRGHLNVGRAILVMSNEDGYFHSDGKSKVERNARMKIWAGFDDLNIPIFTGVVHSVEPTGTTDVVVLNCKDYMGLFQEVLIRGSQDPNNTAKLLIESFCDLANIPAPSIASTDETTSTYTQPKFEEQSILRALEEVCNSIFYVAYFDEDGNLNAVEREYSRLVDFQFKDNNVIDCRNLVDTEIVNDITIEYRENFFSKCEDQASIDTYGRKARSDQTLLLSSELVSDKTTGSMAEELDHALEALKFTSADDAASIDCLHIKMKKDGAHGYITAKIYSDSSGTPGTLLATSQLKASDNLSTGFAWEIFYLSTPVQISPSTDYWVVIDTSSVGVGTVYVQISGSAASAKHAYYSGTWYTEDNKQVLHRIRGSIRAQRVAEDVVRFYKDPHERIRIVAPAVPQLQPLDKVMVDITLREIWGHYVVEGRRHIITPDKYTTIDTLRKQ
jgi:hypothetical protein